MDSAIFDLSMLDTTRLADINLMGDDVRQNWRRYASQWASEPPFYVASFGFPQVITGSYADARSVLLDRDRFTAETPPGHPLGQFDIFKGLPQLNSMEGESHDRLRRLLMPFFKPESIAALSSAIGDLAGELLDAIDATGNGSFDAMADVAEPLVERTLLGVLFEVEEEQGREFIAYSRVMPLSLQPTAEGEYNPAFVAQFERTTAVIEGLIQQRRRDPRADLITTLVAAKDDGFPVSHDEIVGNILAVYAGAQLATATSIGVVLMNLAAHPDQFQLVRADPALAPAAVEESLRIHASGLCGFPRYARVDTEVSGTKIWKDMPVQVGLASANLDPERFSDPQRFDIRRDAKGSLAFSIGAHQCVGSRLAKLMMTETVDRVANRYSELGLADPEFVPIYGGVLGELKPETVPLSAA